MRDDFAMTMLLGSTRDISFAKRIPCVSVVVKVVVEEITTNGISHNVLTI
jgi:hypothetical protein